MQLSDSSPIFVSMRLFFGVNYLDARDSNARPLIFNSSPGLSVSGFKSNFGAGAINVYMFSCGGGRAEEKSLLG